MFAGEFVLFLRDRGFCLVDVSVLIVTIYSVTNRMPRTMLFLSFLRLPRTLRGFR